MSAAHPNPYQPTVYWCYAADGTLLYIGSTEDPIRRRKDHQGGTWWWPSVAHVIEHSYRTIQEARRVERLAIFNEQPLHNVQNKTAVNA